MPRTRTIITVVTELTPEELETISDAAIDKLARSYELAYVDYHDSLGEDDLAALLSGDEERADMVDERIREGWSESIFAAAWDVAADVIKDAIADAGYDDGSNPTGDAVFDQIRELCDGEWFDAVRYAVEERDESDVLAQLLARSGAVAVRYRLDDVDQVDEPWQMSEDEIHETIVTLARQVGVNADLNWAALDTIMCNCGNGGHVEVAAMVEPADLYHAIREAAYDGRQFTITFTDPDLLIINPFAGSGWCEQIEGVVSFPFDWVMLRTDKDAAGWSWDEVVGGGGRPFSSRGPVTITPPVSLAKPVHLGKRPLPAPLVMLGKVVDLARY